MSINKSDRICPSNTIYPSQPVLPEKRAKDEQRKPCFEFQLNYYITAIISFILLFSILNHTPLPVSAQEQTPTEAARVFFHSLGYMNYKKSWEYLSETSKRQLLQEFRKYFWERGQDFSIQELEYLVKSNHKGHRELLFYVVFSRITMKMGVKASSFKTAAVAPEKEEGDKAEIRLTVEGKRAYYTLVKENGEWKVVFY